MDSNNVHFTMLRSNNEHFTTTWKELLCRIQRNNYLAEQMRNGTDLAWTDLVLVLSKFKSYFNIVFAVKNYRPNVIA